MEAEIKELREELARAKKFCESHCSNNSDKYDRRMSSLLTKIDNDVVKLHDRINETRLEGIKAWLLLGGLLLSAVAWASIKFDTVHELKIDINTNHVKIKHLVTGQDEIKNLITGKHP